jgi:glutamate dehydrogenase (NAD(P)+)
MDTYSMKAGHSVPAVITGKPIPLGGSLGRDEATSRGLMYVVREAMAARKLDPKASSVAVQGFGNVGGHAARLLRDELGMKVVAVSDSSGGTYDPSGLDIMKLNAHKKETGAVKDFDQATNITNEELLELDCTVLVPAALEGVITGANADRIKAQIIAEGANGPTLPEADRILYERGRMLIPDILANAGGVTVSYFEWVQDRQGFFWNEQLVNQRLQEIMDESFDAVVSYAEKHNVNNRIAAYMVALDRVAFAIKLRGIYA